MAAERESGFDFFFDSVNVVESLGHSLIAETFFLQLVSQGHCGPMVVFTVQCSAKFHLK